MLARGQSSSVRRSHSAEDPEFAKRHTPSPNHAYSTKRELRLGFAGTNFYLPSTRSIPEKSNSNFDRGSLPTRSVSRDLSREITCDTLATESFGSPVTRADKLTLPGAIAHFRLLVSGTQTTVEIRLWLRASL